MLQELLLLTAQAAAAAGASPTQLGLSPIDGTAGAGTAAAAGIMETSTVLPICEPSGQAGRPQADSGQGPLQEAVARCLCTWFGVGRVEALGVCMCACVCFFLWHAAFARGLALAGWRR
jgi:hypothetical protein